MSTWCVWGSNSLHASAICIVESHVFGVPKLAARASKSAKGVGCFGDLKLNAMIEDRTVAEWARSVWSVDDVTAVTVM